MRGLVCWQRHCGCGRGQRGCRIESSLHPHAGARTASHRRVQPQPCTFNINHSLFLPLSCSVGRLKRPMAEICVKAVLAVADLERRDVNLDLIKVSGGRLWELGRKGRRGSRRDGGCTKHGGTSSQTARTFSGGSRQRGHGHTACSARPLVKGLECEWLQRLYVGARPRKGRAGQ